MAEGKTNDEQYAKDLELLCQAMSIMRDWISKTFKKSFVTSSYLQINSSEDEIEVSTPKICLRRGLLLIEIQHVEIGYVLQMWENVISLNLKNEDFKMEWRNTILMDLQGKFQKVFNTIFTILFFPGKMQSFNIFFMALGIGIGSN